MGAVLVERGVTDAVPASDISRALELTDGYLSEAEDILWATAAEIDEEATSETVEALTQDLWEIQHELQDLQEEFEKS